MSAFVWSGVWGLVAGFALVAGALIGYFAGISQRAIAAVMAFGSGVLIAAVAIELMDEAYRRGGFAPVSIGLLAGALSFTAANVYLSRRGARHRKRSGHQQRLDAEKRGGDNGIVIAVGSLLDGIPEAIVIGLSMIEGGAVSLVTVAAIFISNIPEGLSSAAGMQKAGRRPGYVFGIWGGIALVTGLASLMGFAVFRGLPDGVIAAVMALAAGAILAMLADTMVPEAFAEARDFAGLITAAGFLAAFVLGKIE